MDKTPATDIGTEESGAPSSAAQAEGAPRAKRPARPKTGGDGAGSSAGNGETSAREVAEAASAVGEAPRAADAETEETARIVGEYFEAAVSDPNAQARFYAVDAEVAIHGTTMRGSRREAIEYFRGLRAAFPDFSTNVIDLIAQGDRAAVHWRATGTFAGSAPYEGIEPNGAHIEVQGVDFVRVANGRLVRNDAYPDNMSVARQLGLLPEPGSRGEQTMSRAFNARTRLLRRLGGGEPERVAEGVWLVRGGFPMKTMNVYLIQDGDGVMLFDAGIRAMTRTIGAIGVSMGGITRVLLGHGHADHRGVAPGLGVPILCHEAERADAEGDAGEHYFDFSKLNLLGRLLMPRLLASWDGGPVKIDATVKEGDEIAGFRVIHLPGHAPGMIGLWRESDRLALTSDCFYTLDPQSGRKGHPRVPHSAFNQDTEQARESIRKVAALDPSSAWPGHADPLTRDVRMQLENAAANT
jgi:glyoxylase-like metal-dependent hydrolase (beta-lactamase superfamily II)/predicted ester cyclase